MTTLESLYNEKDQYENLKVNVEKIINQLTVVEDRISPLNVLEAFKINEDFPESRFIDTQKDRLHSKNDILKLSVIPSINAEINRLNSEIAAEQRRLEEERRAREEAERRAKENAIFNNQ